MLKMIQNLINQVKSQLFGVPYYIEEHWQPLYFSFNTGERINGRYVIEFSNSAWYGDEVKVLKDEIYTYVYKVIGVVRAAGDDHIVSPMQFNLTFVRAEPNE